MSAQQRESRGRTVDEAVREALLFMGLRREEVKVTVVQEARSGILGLGRRDAVVLVAKKSDRSTDARGRKQETAGTRTGRRSGGRGRRGRDEENSSEAPSGRRGQARTDRDRAASGESGQSEEQKPRTRGQKRGRNTGSPAEKGARGEGAPQEQGPAVAAVQSGDQAQDQPEDAGRRRRRPRRRRKRQGADHEMMETHVASGAPDAEPVEESPGAADMTPVDTVRQENEAVHAEDAGRDSQVSQVSQESQDNQDSQDSQDSRNNRSRPENPSAQPNAIIDDVAAVSRCRPWTSEDTGSAPEFLERVTTELMIKSGFPCRVQVQEGEYHRVKMVVDDRSAGILIGRYGNTVDAIEHLVDKIAARAAGQRIRMNLDINNYRLRCEDQLVQRARAAAAEARETGDPMAMEPANGRDRRIVHLYIQETGDLVTYTDTGPDGKFVIICRPDQVPESFRSNDMDEEQSTPAAEPAGDIEVDVVIDVDAVAAGGQDAVDRREEEG